MTKVRIVYTKKLNQNEEQLFNSENNVSLKLKFSLRNKIVVEI